MTHDWEQLPAEDRKRVLDWLELFRPTPCVYRGPEAAHLDAADRRVIRALDAARALLQGRREDACVGEGSR